MVVLAENLFAEIRMYGNNESLELKNCPKNIQTLCRWQTRTFFQERSQADKFLEILSKQDPAIKYTADFEGYKTLLNFLGININNY